MNGIYITMSLAMVAGCAHQPAGQAAPGVIPVSPSRFAQTTKQSRAQDQAFVVGLSAAVRDERRDESWAAPKEARLRETFASSLAGHSGVEFRQLTCKSSLCELAFEAGPLTPAPAGLAPSFAAVDQWLAWQQTCGYTLTIETATDSTAPIMLRAFLHCTK